MYVRFNADDFIDKMAFWYQDSKKTLEEQMFIEMKGVVRNIVEKMPPSDFKTKGQAAKEGGWRAIDNDLEKLFYPMKVKDKWPNVTLHTDLPALHKRHRTRRGRINGRPHYPVKLADYNRFRTRQINKVGYMAGGWNRASARLGYKPPAWIWRHSSPGAIRIQVTDTRIRFILTNKVRYAGEMKDIERRVQIGINMQANSLKRRINKHWKARSPFR